MPTFIDAYNTMRGSMERANGVSPSNYPRLTNEQAASVLRATMNTAKKYALPANVTERWYEVALALAGWRQPGDRFLVTAEHRREMLPDAELPILWTLALSVATILQNKGVAFDGVPMVNPTTDYTEVLKQAWGKMQREHKATGQAPPSPVTMPELPAAAPSGGGDGLVKLLALLYIGNKFMNKKGGR